MKNILRFFILILGIINYNFKLTNATAASARREATNDDIHQTLLSLVHSYSVLDNKLERHEQRERSLGELLKKSLQSLQKGQRVFEPIKGTFSRLEERIGQIETHLLTQEERISEQQIKLAEALESVFKWMTQNTGMNEKQVDTRFDADDSEIEKKVTELNNNVNSLRKEIQELKNMKTIDKDAANKLIAQTEKIIVDSKANNPDIYFSTLKDELKTFYITNPVTPAESKDSDLEKKLINELSEIKIGIYSIKQQQQQPRTDIDKRFVEGLINQTIDVIVKSKNDVIEITNKNAMKTVSQIKENENSIGKSMKEINNNVISLNKLSEKFYNEYKDNNTELIQNIDALQKLEGTIAKTAENVLDTKKHIEFGVLQIVVEVEDRIKKIIEENEKSVNKRFDEVSEILLENHHETLSNVTAKVETEMGQVWRQIGIMFNELSAHKATLEKLQEYTEIYVNTTSKTVDDGVEKVASINARVEEMYSNLNYLLGRLSLVNQEFNNIKSGLGSAIENLKSSFSIVKESIADLGPGPHNITDEPDHDPKSNLVKRLAAPYQNK